MFVIRLVLSFLRQYLLSLLFALLLFFGVTWLKARQLHFSPDAWDDFFLSFPVAKAERLLKRLYLGGALIASILNWRRAQALGSGWLAAGFLAGCLTLAGLRWHRQRGGFAAKYQAIPDSIRKKRQK